MGLILAIIAVIFSIIFHPISIIYSLIFWRWKTWKGFCSYWQNVAEALDQLGNVVCQYPLNDICVAKGGSLHGVQDEKISSVLGKNKINKTALPFGIWLSNILNGIEKDHVEKSIDNTVIDDLKED